MFTYETLWDVYEMKFVIFFWTVVAVVLGCYIYDRWFKYNDDNKNGDM